jgi:hypothetical protein
MVTHCPNCQAPELVAVRRVLVEYRIDGEDWIRAGTDDDSAEVLRVSCEGCGTEFDPVELDGEGQLVRLGTSDLA